MNQEQPVRTIKNPVTWEMVGTLTVSYREGETLEQVLSRALEQPLPIGSYINASLQVDCPGISEVNQADLQQVLSDFPELAEFDEERLRG